MRKCFYGYSQNTTGPLYCPKSTLCNDQQVIITSIWWWWDHHHNQPVIIESPSSFALSTTLNSCWHIFYYPFAFMQRPKPPFSYLPRIKKSLIIIFFNSLLRPNLFLNVPTVGKTRWLLFSSWPCSFFASLRGRATHAWWMWMWHLAHEVGPCPLLLSQQTLVLQGALSNTLIGSLGASKSKGINDTLLFS